MGYALPPKNTSLRTPESMLTSNDNESLSTMALVTGEFCPLFGRTPPSASPGSLAPTPTRLMARPVVGRIALPTIEC
jgi:hypothetical protein